MWKPYIIYKTLQQCDVSDVVYYADAGCTINAKSQEWASLAQLIEKHSAIFFHYKSDFDYGWERFCTRPENNSVAIKHWMKPIVVEFFRKWFGNDDFLSCAKIWAGFCVVKKEEAHTVNRVIDDWLKIALFHPSLFMDPWGPELNELPDTFNVHRHDLPILTLLVHHYKDKCDVAIVPETSESDKENAAIVATRWRQPTMPFFLYLKYRIYDLIRGRKR